MKSKRFLFLALLVLVAIGVFVMNSWKLRKPVESDFKLVAVTRGTIDLTVLATGVVQPENRLEIKPAIAGRRRHLTTVVERLIETWAKSPDGDFGRVPLGIVAAVDAGITAADRHAGNPLNRGGQVGVGKFTDILSGDRIDHAN